MLQLVVRFPHYPHEPRSWRPSCLTPNPLGRLVNQSDTSLSQQESKPATSWGPCCYREISASPCVFLAARRYWTLTHHWPSSVTIYGLYHLYLFQMPSRSHGRIPALPSATSQQPQWTWLTILFLSFQSRIAFLDSIFCFFLLDIFVARLFD